MTPCEFAANHGALAVGMDSLRVKPFRRSPDYRAFAKRVQKQGMVPEDLEAYLGYGMFVGRKPTDA